LSLQQFLFFSFNFKKFSPQNFYDPTNPTKFCTYFAIGSQDSILSVWKTTEKKPILVTKKLFVEGISDLCWSKDGLKLLVSSRDGSLAYLQFNETELGKKQPNHLKKQYLNDVYGDIGDSFNISENPISMEATLKSKKRIQPQNTKEVPEKQSVKKSQPTPAQNVRQIETVKDGKRRIQPQQVETVKDGKRRIQPMIVTSNPAENTKPLFDPINDSDEEDDDFQEEEEEEEESEDEDLMEEEGEGVDQESEELEESNSKNESKPMNKKRPRNENAEKFIKRHKEDKLYFRINEKDEIKCTPKGNVEFIFDGAVKWSVPIKETILMATANSNFVAVIGASNSLHIFSNGVRLFPPIALSAEPVFIASNKKSDLVVLCQDSSLNVWNIANKECTVECTVDSLISKSEEGEIGNLLIHSIFR
jgi:hypothetical protein